MISDSNNICAGIVLYNPDVDRLLKAINSVVYQVRKIIIVDNASANIKEIKKQIENIDNIHLICNQTNKGIATALNQICSFAKRAGCLWCLTLDQDTICNSDMVKKLLIYQDTSRIGIICPLVNYEGLNIKAKNIKDDTTDIKGCMTSGSLTNLGAWNNVGGFREEYFIDFVDNEFCIKIRLAGYRIVRVNSCYMHHQLGYNKTISFLGVNICKISSHSPLRLYYMTRNNLLYIFEYKKNLNLPIEYVKLLKTDIEGILSSNQKFLTFHYILKGIRDAIRGISGKYIE